jgi:glutaredoxin
MPTIKIYSTNWCQFCQAEKKFLATHKQPYQDIDVEADRAAAAEMVSLSGQQGVPFTVITRDDGVQVGILGFDRPRLTSELKLTA